MHETIGQLDFSEEEIKNHSEALWDIIDKDIQKYVDDLMDNKNMQPAKATVCAYHALFAQFTAVCAATIMWTDPDYRDRASLTIARNFIDTVMEKLSEIRKHHEAMDEAMKHDMRH